MSREAVAVGLYFVALALMASGPWIARYETWPAQAGLFLLVLAFILGGGNES